MRYKHLWGKWQKEIAELVKQFKKEWWSLRSIAKRIEDERGISIWFGTVQSIISLMELDEISEEIEENVVDYDEENLYVYTKRINKYWEKEIVKHDVPFWLLNEIQKAYSQKGRNWSQQQILDNNWWDEESPIYIKPQVWMAIKNTLWLNKLSWVANEIFLKILQDKFWEDTVDSYLQELAHTTTRQKFRDMENKQFERAIKKQYEDVIRTWARLEEYVEQICEHIESRWRMLIDFETIDIWDTEWTLYVLFWDMHVWRTTDELIKNVLKMSSYIKNSGAKKVKLINVWDNMESPMLQWMHVSQILEMDYRWFEQITVAADILRNLIKELSEEWIDVKMEWIVGNHWRWTSSTEDDPQRLPELAMYAILDAQTWVVNYSKKPIHTFTTNEFNFIVSHWDYWFANKSPDQIMSMITSLWWIDLNKHTIIVNGHYHNPQINQWPTYTKIQLPSLNLSDSYSQNIVMRGCFPWFATLECLGWKPLISFIPC